MTYIVYDTSELNGAALVDVVFTTADDGCCRNDHGHVVVVCHDTGGRGDLKNLIKMIVVHVNVL